MGIRIMRHDWQKNLWKFVTHPITEILVLVALVLVALATLIALESRDFRGPDAPVVFSPK